MSMDVWFGINVDIFCFMQYLKQIKMKGQYLKKFKIIVNNIICLKLKVINK